MIKKIKYIFIILTAVLSAGSASLICAQEDTLVITPVAITIDSLEINNTQLLDALDLVAVKTEIKIVVDPQIEGKVSIYLKNVDLYDALRIILEANGMAFAQIEGSEVQKQEALAMKLAEGKMVLGEPQDQINQPAIEVMTASEFEIKFGSSFSDKIQTRIISLVHFQGDEVLSILNQMKGPLGKVIYNEQTNALILMDEPDKLKAMATVVQEWDTPLVTKKFYLKYVQAEQMLPLVQEVLNSETGKVDIEDAANALIVTDKSLRLKEIEDLIQRLDIEERHILIETKILQIILSDEHQEGIDWEAIVSNYQSLGFNKNLSHPQEVKGFAQNFNVPDPNGENPVDKLSLGTISEEDYEVLLDALDTVGDIHIISNAKLSTLHGKAAELIIKTLNYQSLDKTQGRAARKEEEHKNEAPATSEIKFQVMPLVNSDATLTLNIGPDEILIEDQEAEVKNGEEVNGVNVKVQQGSTVVMGGLFKETMVELKEKIPLLGDIPILGLAFRHQGPRPRKAEIIVFLTPKVVIKE